ncbi:hypothetical protein [Parasediminibacterium sp. JCM 36343]|uniref:hypothetical protein n=1 Tax=Parasediminibacterium sp. JCM 36343 TaxID=3374279 RepID=UPI003979D0D0
MAFKQGESGNKTGRPKGKPNKVTGNLREWINKFINNNREQMEADFKALEPKDRIVMFEKLLKYTLPTLQATSLTADFAKMTDEQLDEIINQLKKSNND